MALPTKSKLEDLAFIKTQIKAWKMNREQARDYLLTKQWKANLIPKKEEFKPVYTPNISPVVWWLNLSDLNKPVEVPKDLNIFAKLDPKFANELWTPWQAVWQMQQWQTMNDILPTPTINSNTIIPEKPVLTNEQLKPLIDYKPKAEKPVINKSSWIIDSIIPSANAEENKNQWEKYLTKDKVKEIIDKRPEWVEAVDLFNSLEQKGYIMEWYNDIPQDPVQTIKPPVVATQDKGLLWNVADYWLWLSERLYTWVEDYATDVTNLWLKAFWQEPVKPPREQLFPTWEEYKPWLLWRTVDTTIKTAKDINKSLNTKWQSEFESWFQWAWKLVWWLVDIFWDTVMTWLSTASPVVVKDTIKEEFKKALESQPWKTALEIWNEFKSRYKYFSQENPRAWRNIDAIWNIIDWVVNVYWWKLTKTWIDKVDDFWKNLSKNIWNVYDKTKETVKNIKVPETIKNVWDRLKQWDVEYKFKVWETNPEIITPTKKVNKNYQPEEYAKQIDEQTKAELRQATRPSITWIDTTWKYAKQDEKLLNWVKEVVNQGHTPKTTKEALEKISESKKQIWNNIEETNRKVDIKTNWKDLKDDIYNFIDDADNDDLFRANPELETKLKNYADSVETNKRFQDLSQEDLQNLLTDMNSKTPSSKFLQQLDTNPIETQKNIVIAKILREKTEKNLMDTLWITNQELRNKYWALRELEKNLAKRYWVFARQNPSWIVDMFSMDALPDMLIWLATGDFKQAWKWFLKKVWAKFIKSRNNPDTIIANIFKKQAELKNPKKWISEKLWEFVANAKWQETEINLKTNFNKDGTKWNTTTSNPNRNNPNILQPTNTNTNNNLNPTIIKPDNKSNLVDNKKTTGDWINKTPTILKPEWKGKKKVETQTKKEKQTFWDKKKEQASDFLDAFAEKFWWKSNFLSSKWSWKSLDDFWPTIKEDYTNIANKEWSFTNNKTTNITKADLEDFTTYIDTIQAKASGRKIPTNLTNKQTEALKGQISNRILKNEANDIKRGIIQGNKQITNTYLDSVKRQKIKSIGEKLTEFVKKNVLPSEFSTKAQEVIDKISKFTWSKMNIVENTKSPILKSKI